MKATTLVMALLITALSAIAARAPAAWAQATVAGGALRAPHERPILTIRGNIGQRNHGASAVFDLPMLEALPQHSLTTRTPWDAVAATYSGPRLRDVLALVQSRGRQLRAIALDDYRAVIPIDDVMRHDVIIATRKNGQLMNVRQKGPLFIMYPFDSHPSLKDKRYYERAVWQLVSLEVE